MKRRDGILLSAGLALTMVLVLPGPANSELNEQSGLTPCAVVPTLCELIAREAQRTGLDPALIDAVIKIESDYRTHLIGAAGEIGLMQVLPSTAKLLGFNGTNDELAEPETNIRLGVTYLARAWSLAQGDLCRALMKYRAGHGQEQMTPLSTKYCRRAREHLSAQLGRVAQGATHPATATRLTTAQVPPIDPRLRGQAFWAAQAARVRTLTVLVHQRWDMIARSHRIQRFLFAAEADVHA